MQIDMLSGLIDLIKKGKIILPMPETEAESSQSARRKPKKRKSEQKKRHKSGTRKGISFKNYIIGK
jgi:hypothetical protein